MSLAKRKNNPSLGSNSVVTRGFCDERFQRSLDQIARLEQGILDVKQVSIEKADELKIEIQNIKKEKEEESHFWRNLLGTIVGGGLVAFIAFLLGQAHL